MFNEYFYTEQYLTQGKIGRLQTLTTYPVIAGDQISINLVNLWRQSQLRRSMAYPMNITLAAFFIPHRRLVPEEAFTNFVRGESYNQWTDPTHALPLPTAFGIYARNANVPFSRIDSYLRIYNEYFRNPLLEDPIDPATAIASGGVFDVNRNPNRVRTLVERFSLANSHFSSISSSSTRSQVNTALTNWVNAQTNPMSRQYVLNWTLASTALTDWEINSDNQLEIFMFDSTTEAITATDNLSFGLQVTHPASLHSTTMDAYANDDDFSVDIADSSVDLRDIKEKMGDAETALDHLYNTNRYRDIIEDLWEGAAPYDADNRPELLGMFRDEMFSEDIDGTDSENLGQSAGKSAKFGGMNIPDIYFPEHGTIHIMVVNRTTPLWQDAKHPLDCLPLSSDNIGRHLADPRDYSRQRPTEWTQADLYHGGSEAVKMGYYPIGQEFRMGVNHIHPRFYAEGFNTGYPAIPMAQNTTDLIKCPSSVYDNIYASLVNQHWQTMFEVSFKRISTLPPAGSSLFSGTNL